jgi:tetratricopeptide (TPR) repeat protein
LKRGLRAVAQWNYDDALPDLDAAIDGGIEDARAFWARSRALTFHGRVKHLDEDGNEIPDKTPATAGGKKLSPEERRERALADIRRAVELDPLNARYRRDLSFLLIAKPDLAEAFIGNDTEKGSIENGEAKEQAGLAMELDPKINSYRTWYESFK